MPEFRITDRRGLPRQEATPTGRTPVSGIVVPNPGDIGRASRRSTADPVATEMRKNRRQAALRKRGSMDPGGFGDGIDSANLSFAMGRPRDPMFYWRQNNLPFDISKDEEMAKLREFCRLLYLTHPVIASCIDIYSKYPLQGMSVTCKDTQLQEFYDDLFFTQLDYKNYLVSISREKWICGEAFPLGTFNETLGVWESEELLHPSDVYVERSILSRDPRFLIKLPEALRDVLRNRQPVWEYNQLVQEYPELVAYAGENSRMPVSSMLLKQLKFEADTFHKRGIPIIMRAFRSVLQEEMLNTAMDAISDRLYTPLILAKLGASATDLGTEVPWIPTEDDMEDFREAFDAAMAGDFRVMVHNFATTIESVFGREEMPDLSNDFDRLDDRILQTFGLSRTMLQGAESGETYAADALNRDVVTELMSVGADVRAPILQSWRKGPVLRTMAEVWEQAEKFRPISDDGFCQQIELPVDNNPIYTLSFHQGMAHWNKIRYIMRHHYDGPMVRLTQKWGEVFVTPNHSVYASDGSLVEPKTNPELLAMRHLNAKNPPQATSARLSVPSSRVQGGWASKLHKDGAKISHPGGPRKVSSLQIQEIRTKAAQGVLRATLAEDYGISVGYVGWIVRGVIKRDWEREIETGQARVTLKERLGRSKFRVNLEGEGLRAFLRFLGAWISEGSICTDANSGDVISVANSELGWLQELQQDAHLYIGEGKSWISKGVTPNPGHKQMWSLVMSNKTLGTWLRINAGKGAHSKRIPDFIFGLRKDYVDIFAAAMIRGDGSVVKSGSWRYFTRSEELAQGVTLLCLLHGIQYTIGKDKRTNVYRIAQCDYYETREDEVRICEEVPYSGWVYDFEMANVHRPNFTIGVGQPVVHNTHHQQQLKDFFDGRARIVAEAQEHFDYDVRNGKRYVKMEEVLEIDEETGEQKIIEQPKLLVPELAFDTLNLSDEQQERQFIEALTATGVPIPQERRILGTGIDFDEMLEIKKQEQIRLVVMEQETRKETYEALRDAGLPIPEDLLKDFRPRIGAPEPAGDAALPAMGTQDSPTPALAPSEDDQADNLDSQTDAQVIPMPVAAIPQEGDQRPPESDEARATMPKPAGRKIAGVNYRYGQIRTATAEHYRDPDNSIEDTHDEDGTVTKHPENYRPAGIYADPHHVGMRRYVEVPEAEKWKAEWDDEESA